ncbi:MAG: deoxyribonuclease V [Thermodesulfobacteriota bacterium]
MQQPPDITAPSPDGRRGLDLAWARQEQERLAAQVVLADRFGNVRRVAGLDVHFSPDGRRAWAAAAMLSFPELEPLEQAVAEGPVPLPYVPGFLSFREAPAALAALARLSGPPDLLLCDGQGIAHPRRCGLACHLGVMSGLPSIGAAKSRLLGSHRPPGRARGAWAPLLHQDRVIGAVLRTVDGVRPLYVSPGHRISLPTAIALTLACGGRYRLPEPLRAAHRLAAAAVC